MADLHIYKYVNGFSVFSDVPYIRTKILHFCQNELTLLPFNASTAWHKQKWKKPNDDKKDEYFYKHNTQGRWYFINAIYDEFIDYVCKNHYHGVGEIRIEVENVAPNIGKSASFKNHKLNLLEPEGSYFAFQNDMVEYAQDPEKNHVVFEVQTGRGKTKSAFKTIVRRARRTLLITKPAFVPKWINDVEENLAPAKGELVNCRTLDSLLDLIEICDAGEDDDIEFIVIASTIIDNFLKRAGDGFYQTTQITELLVKLGVGSVIYDESHMFFKKNYISFLTLNSAFVLDLSATLRPGQDPFLKERYNERFPPENRYDKLEYVVYSEAYSIYYGFKDKKVLKRINKLPQYNHTAVEEIIFSSPVRMRNYFDMIMNILRRFYLNKYTKGRKAIVFFSTKTMCTKFKEYAELQAELDHLYITRSIEGDDFNEFIKGDLYVSTPGKSGTAVDLPGLMLSVITPAVSSEQLNEQMLGRTRDNRNENDRPKIVYLHCNRIPKHVKYLNDRRRLLENKVTKFVIMNSKFVV